jgi:hypothetical protein
MHAAVWSALTLAISPVSNDSGRVPMLDGGSSLWAEKSASYAFKCAGGSHAKLKFEQKRGEYPVLTKFDYSGRPVLGSLSKSINSALQRFWTVENVSPRCLKGGGVQVLLGGVSREDPKRRAAILLRADEKGLTILP